MAAPPPRSVLVTGCSSGIGLALAARLARDPHGRFQVIATMRDLGKRQRLEEAAGSALGRTLSIQRLDVSSDSSVAECMASIPGGHVDVLVNNAGVGHVGPLESTSLEQMKHVFETNFFGAVRMIRAVLPGMKRRRRGHILVLSSVMGLQGEGQWERSAGSGKPMGAQHQQWDVSLVEPGPVCTDFELKLLEEVSRSEYPGTDEVTLGYFKDVYIPASREIFRTLGQSPGDVAEAIVSVLCSPRPPLRAQTNALYTPVLALKYADPTGELSVRGLHRMLFRHSALLRGSAAVLRCLTCGCLRTRVRPL
uniref:Ketoreductase domain-containing protein n=1 Tax=Melopsittacus undulatus TaxID=13146 RepID=A0A8V5GWR4_MELUD